VLRPGEARGRLDVLLSELNSPQRAAATRPDGPLLVVAGPGAGKTRVIVARVAHLLLARGVPADGVAAITFSRRAAGELQERLAALAGAGRPSGPAVWAGTFHALGARILRQGGAARFGRPLNFTIYDADDAERTLRRVLGAIGVPANRVSRLGTAARHAVSLAKRQTPGGTNAPAYAEATGGEGVAIGEGEEAVPLSEVLPRYDAALRESAAFDFDDLVGCAAAALEEDAPLRAWARAGARHLLVDEYQDTDAAQEALLQRLAPPAARPDLCVVADPQQSIYAFRGAAPEQVRRFLEVWPAAAVARLEQNYRSTKSIVAVARRLSAVRDASEGRFALRLWTDNPAGTPARLWVAPHPEREAAAIAGDVAALLAGGTAAEEVAVLVRTHAQARPIEAAMLRAGVPYVLIGGVRFFAREEIKDALAYLRLAIMREDAAAFWRIVNTPRRGLGPAALLTVARYALSGEVAPPLIPWMEGGVEAGRSVRGPVAGSRRWAATEGAPDGLYDLLAHVDELTGLWYAGEGPAALLDTALQRTAYRDHLRREHPEDAPARLDALSELLRLASGYDDVRRFLDDAALSGEADDPGVQSVNLRGRVRLSTVHAAKGLEFRAVYVPGCEMGLFPLGTRSGAGAAGGAAGPEDGTEDGPDEPPLPGHDPEERRVFYVAVTRARERLTLSYCTFRRDERTRPSPYLAEIGRGLLRRAKLGTDEPPAPKKAPRAKPGPDEPPAPKKAPRG
jgi:DNA helicase-2/ATP-dependent DNA helicase PcrA